MKRFSGPLRHLEVILTDMARVRAALDPSVVQIYLDD